MEYMENQAQMQIDSGIAEQAAKDERAAIVTYLRSGGETVRGVWYGWDGEMRGYYAGVADAIERTAHHAL